MSEGARSQDRESSHCYQMKMSKLMLVAEVPELHLSPEERRYFGQLFAAADTDKIGVITGEVAIKFFEKTKLPPTSLGEVCVLCLFSLASLIRTSS